MHTRLLLALADHQALYRDLQERGVKPYVFKTPPASYPAMACWVERDIDSMSYGWDASGDYVYPSDFLTHPLQDVAGPA